MKTQRIIGWIVGAFALVTTGAENLSETDVKYFETHIRPALSKYCYECHSLETGKTKGGLLLDTREAMLQGGDSGDLLDPKDPLKSLFWDAVSWSDRDYAMPPKNKMPAEVIAHFKKWLEMGAPDPRKRESIVVESHLDIEAGKKHWAFQPPKTVANTTIDKLVNANLKQQGLRPAAAADSATLLRRLNFDLIGLPPTPTEVTAFVAVAKRNLDKAVEAKVDELLARPQYGERWGRHWLDVARYAESSGQVNFTFPHAWRYRDYVIDAFNRDLPYDRFVQEQIAGDLLPFDNVDQRMRQSIATGFLAIGIKRLNERNPRQFTMDMVDEQIDATSQAFLGLTVACARCHDHKSDPVPITDYYAMAGIFMSTATYYGTQAGLQNHRPAGLITLPASEQMGKTYSQSEISQLKADLKKLEDQARNVRLEVRKTGKRPDQRQMVVMRNRTEAIKGTLKKLDENGVEKAYSMGVRDKTKAVNAKVLLRGEVERPGQEAPRGLLQVLDDNSFKAGPTESGRLALANWLSSDKNPLAARVMVNRIWQNLFGHGLVASANNFGMTGQAPSNQALLDHLAIRFVAHDWSVKQMIREITRSDAYRRSADYNEQNYAQDPENRHHWRMSPKQLDAEALRDASLMMSGNLDLEPMVGSATMTHGDTRVERFIDQDALSYQHKKRSVYLPVMRDFLPESLELFDFADPNASSESRSETIVAPQAMYMLNGSFAIEQARDMALRLKESHAKAGDRVRAAFLEAYGRPVTQTELAQSATFIMGFAKHAKPIKEPIGERMRQTMRRRFADSMMKGRQRKGAAGAMGSGMGSRMGMGEGLALAIAKDAAPNPLVGLSAEELAWTAFCQALMASAEFRIIN